MKKKSKSNIKGNLVLLAVTCAVLLIFAEILFRTVFYVPLNVQVPDSLVVYKNVEYAKAHVLSEEIDIKSDYNNLGFNDIDRFPQKDSGVYRIVVFGDSFVQGSNVLLEETLSSRIEQQLQKRNIPVKFEVLNFGVSSYTQTKHLKNMKYVASKFDPDLYIVTYTSRGDLISNLEDPIYSMSEGKLEERNMSVSSVMYAEKWISSKSHFAAAIDRFIAASISSTGPMHKVLYAMGVTKTNPLPPPPVPVEVIEYTEETYYPEAYDKTELILSEIDLFSKKTSTPWYFVLLPTKEQVDMQYRDAFFEKVGAQNVTPQMDKVNEFLMEVCEKEEYKCLNLLPHFLAEKNKEELYFMYDWHWNAKGIAFGAEVIVEQMLRESIVSLPAE